MVYPVYITNIGMITALGDNPVLVDAAVQAGISAHGRSDYLTADKHSITMSAVPEEALPGLEDDSSPAAYLNRRNRRLLRMCQQAAAQALDGWSGATPITLILASTEAYPDIDYRLDDKFIALLQEQSGLPIDIETSCILYAGRVGVMQAIDRAFNLLQLEGQEAVLVGGADTCQFSELVALLDRDHRLSAQRVINPRVRDDFIAGEGACFLLLTSDAGAAMNNGRHRVAITRPGFGHEAGHLYSDQNCLGDGMDQAFKQALAQGDAGEGFHRLYSSMNGERYWAREIAVARLRNRRQLQDTSIEHPADCYGDLGAASAAVLIALAQTRTLAGGNDTPNRSLVCCAADLGARAALGLLPERIG